MNVQVAPDRFRFRVDLLPGETVLWEGGAERRSIWAESVRIAGIVLLTAGLFVGMLGSDLNDPAVDRGAASLTAPELRTKLEKQSRDAAEWQRAAMAGLGRGLVALTLGLGLIAWGGAWLRWRKAWYVITTERVCMQTGAFATALTTIDLDRIVSVQASAGFVEGRFGLQDIALVHCGMSYSQYAAARLGRNPYVIASVAKDSELLTHLVTEWLPRDGRRSIVGAA